MYSTHVHLEETRRLHMRYWYWLALVGREEGVGKVLRVFMKAFLTVLSTPECCLNFECLSPSSLKAGSHAMRKCKMEGRGDLCKDALNWRFGLISWNPSSRNGHNCAVSGLSRWRKAGKNVFASSPSHWSTGS